MFAAFAAGVYVGRLPLADLALGSRVTTPAQESFVPMQASDAGQEEMTNTPASAQEKPVTVPTTQLSAGQRELLTKLGINADAITITTAMIACAQEKLGAARFAEIQGGATPTFTEGASLLACYR